MDFIHFLEFLSKGTPIISSNIGGINSLIYPEKMEIYLILRDYI